MAAYPWLVACIDERVVGYAYGGPLRSRAAYRFSVETSIYLDIDCLGKGVGTKLYQSLFHELSAAGLANAYAGMTLPNAGSMALHRKFGFEMIGVFPSVGFKFDVWHDVAWMHRKI